MQQEIIDFINEHEDLINWNDWEEVYDKLGLSYRSGLTEILLQSDIHPENYLTELPANFLLGSTIKEFTIPNNITSIGSSAFYDCSSLTSVVIGDGVTSIGNYAFEYCSSLTNATIGNSVTSIGRSAFQYCESLTSVTIGNGVTSIGYRAFHRCTSLTSIRIPESVISIDSDAFADCWDLVQVTIPHSVTSIGYEAFADCGHNLVIDYNGTKDDWKKIYNLNAFKNTYFTVNCSDGKIIKKKR